MLMLKTIRTISATSPVSNRFDANLQIEFLSPIIFLHLAVMKRVIKWHIASSFTKLIHVSCELISGIKRFSLLRVRALVEFGSRTDEAIYLLSHRFRRFGEVEGCQDLLPSLATDVNNIVRKAENVFTLLVQRYPTVEHSVSRHDDDQNFSVSPALAGYKNRRDHIL